MDDKQVILSVVFTTLLLLLLVAGIFISTYIAGRHRMQQEIKIAHLELNFEKEMRKAETEVSENMMQQFAQELHDNIGHILTCMRITIENKKMDSPEMVSSYAPIEGYLDEASDQIRLLSRSLNTDYVNNIGLPAAIELEVKRINNLKRQTIHWETTGSPANIDKNIELLVFRIFQEIMNNSIKHSKAKNIHVQLNTDGGFSLSVRDDGQGFDYEKTINSSRASGLKNILKRAEMTGMKCTVEASVGGGCSYTLRKTAL